MGFTESYGETVAGVPLASWLPGGGCRRGGDDVYMGYSGSWQ
jgi:hypothetical protein